MALSWWVEDIEDFKNVVWRGSEDDPDGVTMNPVTHGLIFLTISVGLGEITDSNADEFYARAHIVEQLHGAMCRIGGEEVYLTPQEVKQHIGLRTNVRNETRIQWAKRMFVGPPKRDRYTSDVSITSDYARNYRSTTQEVNA